jgi:hypothetical protein
MKITHRSIPWPNKSAVEASHLVISGERMPIDENVTPILAQIMKQCWEEDPKKRPTFEDICKMLKKYKEDESDSDDDSGKKVQEPTLAPNVATQYQYSQSPLISDKPTNKSESYLQSPAALPETDYATC